jgi:hypothetical protein
MDCPFQGSGNKYRYISTGWASAGVDQTPDLVIMDFWMSSFSTRNSGRKSPLKR